MEARPSLACGFVEARPDFRSDYYKSRVKVSKLRVAGHVVQVVAGMTSPRREFALGGAKWCVCVCGVCVCLA